MNNKNEQDWKNQELNPEKVWGIILNCERNIKKIAYTFNSNTGNYLGLDSIEDIIQEIHYWIIDLGNFKGENPKGFTKWLVNKNTTTRLFDYLTKTLLPHQISRARREKIDREIRILNIEKDLYTDLNIIRSEIINQEKRDDNLEEWYAFLSIRISELEFESNKLFNEVFVEGKAPHTIKKEKAKLISSLIIRLKEISFLYLDVSQIDEEITKLNKLKGVDLISSTPIKTDDNNSDTHIIDTIHSSSSSSFSNDTLKLILEKEEYNSKLFLFLNWVIETEPFKEEFEILFSIIFGLTNIETNKKQYKKLRNKEINLHTEKFNEFEKRLLKNFDFFFKELNKKNTISKRSESIINNKKYSVLDTILFKPSDFDLG